MHSVHCKDYDFSTKDYKCSCWMKWLDDAPPFSLAYQDEVEEGVPPVATTTAVGVRAA